MKATSMAIAVAAVLTGCRPPSEEVQSSIAPSVRTAEIRHEQAPPMVREGEISAAARLRLGFRAAGVLRDVLVREGDAVRKGQLLADLDGADVAAVLLGADADLGEATRESETTQHLLDTGSVPRREYDRAANALERARAKQRQARQSLDDTRLFSPVTGRVYARSAEPGEVAGPGRTVLVIDEDGEPCVRVGLPERDLRRVARGQEVTVSTQDDGAGRPHVGKVTSIVAAPNVEDALYTVEVRPSGGRWDDLRLGARVSLTFVEGVPATVVRVPLDAVVRRHDRDMVFVIEGGSASGARATVARAREVTLGRAEGTLVALQRGVNDGEKIVTEGGYFLQDGDRVLIAE